MNPLAGCLPALAQIPIFILFYRALLRLAEDDLLQERFLSADAQRAERTRRE